MCLFLQKGACGSSKVNIGSSKVNIGSSKVTTPPRPRKGIFCLFLSVSLCFSLAFFLASPFSISLSLPLSSSFLSFFLLVFLFCFLLLPCFCLFLSFSFLFAFVSWKEQHQNIKLQIFPSSMFSLSLVSCLVFSLKSLFLSLLFPDFKLCSCSTSMYLVSKTQVQKHKFLVKRGGCNKTSFYEPVFCKMWKLSFLGIFGANFSWCSL